MTKLAKTISADQNRCDIDVLSGVFEMVSFHNTLFAVNANNRMIHKERSLLSKEESKLQLVKCEGSHFALLFTENFYSGHIRCSPSSWLQHCQLVRLNSAGIDKEQVSLNLVATAALVTASNVYDDTKSGLVKTNTIKANNYEFFTLAKIHGKSVPKDINECLRWLTKHISDGRCLLDSLLKVLLNKTFSSTQMRLITPNILLLLSNRQLEFFSEYLISNKEVLNEFIAIFPNDKWAKVALKELSNWKLKHKQAHFISRLIKGKSKNNNNTITLSTDIDFLSRAGQNYHSVSPPHLVNSFARKSIQAEKTACVIATARNEGIYLLEWVAYYLALGFDKIFLYSNDNSDNSDELLKALADEGVITWVNNQVSSDGNAQGKAYGHALSYSPEVLLYDWALIVDVDEFFSYNTDIYDSLGDFLSMHSRSNADVIGINWVYIGSSGIPLWEDKPILSRLNYQVGAVNRHIKSFVKPRSVFQSGPHFPKCDERSELDMRSASGEKHVYGQANVGASIAKALSDKPDDSYACLFHFFNRTAEEFLWKWSRNRGDYPKSEGDIFLALDERFLKGFINQFNNQENNAVKRLQSCVPDIQLHINHLLKTKAIAVAQDKVNASFKERSKRVLDAYKPLLKNDFGDAGKKMLALIEGENRV